MEQNHSIDATKGGLILLVIIGHVLYGTLQDNAIRYYIYSFHMPFFLFVSGYLINVERLKAYSFRELLMHYSKRMLGVWCIAWCIFTALVIHNDISLHGIVHNIAHPYYHLWYVPTLFFMICITFYGMRLAHDARKFFSIMFGISVITLTVGCMVHFPGIMDLKYMVYFMLGLLCRHCASRKLISINIWGGYAWLLYTLFMVVLYMFIKDSRLWDFNPLLNSPFVAFMLIFWLTPVLWKDECPRSEILEFLGKNSLQVYLWHMLPVMALKHFFPESSSGWYYLSSAILFGLFLLIVKVIVGKQNNSSI